MSAKKSLLGLLYLSVLLVVFSCSTTEDIAAEGSVSNDAERLHRIDSLSAVRKDSVSIERSLTQPDQPVTKRKEEK